MIREKVFMLKIGPVLEWFIFKTGPTVIADEQP
jgi:hypothetical protein